MRAVDSAEIAVRIRPLVPNRHALFVERADIGVAAQKPKQLVDDRLEMQLLRRQERETFPQIKSRLRPKDRNRPDAGPIGPRLSARQDEAEEIVILTHEIKLVMPPELANAHRTLL